MLEGRRRSPQGEGKWGIFLLAAMAASAWAKMDIPLITARTQRLPCWLRGCPKGGTVVVSARLMSVPPRAHRSRLASWRIALALAPPGLGECCQRGLARRLVAVRRRAACRRLAEAGCTVHEIAAISGHASLREVALHEGRRSGAARASGDGAAGKGAEGSSVRSA
jgi:hypothetical protein